MAELSITAANVKITEDTVWQRVQYAEPIDQGETVYFGGDGKAWKGDNVNAEKSKVKGIALTPNIADGYGLIAIGGTIDLGTTLSVGQTYSQASTEGKIELESDVASTEFVTTLGVAISTALLKIGINASGVAHA